MYRNAKYLYNNDEIIKSGSHLKDKILITPENSSSYLIKRTVCSLIFNCTSNKWNISYAIPVVYDWITERFLCTQSL